jgi:hypothetical protein
MNNTHTLEILKALIKTYFSMELQYDESPAGAKKRKDIQKAILELTK